MSKTLASRVALVTGGSRGIGAAIAKRLADEGATVAITYTKSREAAASVVKSIERTGGNAIAIQADAADAAAVKAAIEKIVATFGTFDVLAWNSTEGESPNTEIAKRLWRLENLRGPSAKLVP